MTGDICELLYQQARRRPGEDFWMEIDGEQVLLVQSAELAKSVLDRPDDFTKDMSNMVQISGHSRITENNYAWECLYRASQPLLSNIKPDRICQAAIRHAASAVTQLTSPRHAETPRVDQLILEDLTARVLADCLFEIDLDLLGSGVVEDVSEFLKFIKLNTPYSGHYARQTDVSAFRNLGSLRLRWLRRFTNLEPAILDNRFFRRIRDATVDPCVPATLEQEVLFFLGAGSETSAATLSWAMVYLADNPALQDDLRSALDTYWAGDELDFSALLADECLASVLHQVMCLYPAVPLVVRVPIDDNRLGEHELQQGRHILVSIVGVGYGHVIAPNGQTLRLSDLTDAPSNLDDVIRFGRGPRKCGGQRMATTEMIVVLAYFLRKLKFVRTANEAIQFSWQLSMTCQDGVPVTVAKL